MTLTASAEKSILCACAAFILLLTGLSTKIEVTLAGNEASRFATIQAVAERGSFSIEGLCFRTVDYVVIDGKPYSDKPLPQGFFLGLLYKGLSAATGISFESKYYLSVFLVTFLGVGVLNCVLFLLFFRLLSREAPSAPFFSRLFLSASLPLATLLFSYGVSMNNHTPAALVLFALLWQLLDYPVKASSLRAFLLGLTAGALLNLEIPIGGVFGLACFLAVVLCSKDGVFKKAVFYSLGGLIPILFFALLDYYAFGRFTPQYIGSGSSGSFKLPLPGADSLYYSFSALLGVRGFFSYMPALLFVFPAALALRGRQDAKAGSIALGAGAACVVFYVLCTNEYGGWAYGFRYLVPLIPLFWFFIAREYAARVGSLSYAVLCALVLWGGAVSYVGSYNPWCGCYEGYRSPPSCADYYVRNSFAANLLCMSFESGGPDGFLYKLLSERLYDPALSVAYLNESFKNTKNLEMLAKLRAYCESDPRTRGRIKYLEPAE